MNINSLNFLNINVFFFYFSNSTIASGRRLNSTASPIRGGTTEMEFRVISGRETIPVRTHANAELTAPVSSLPSNAIATLVFQRK